MGKFEKRRLHLEDPRNKAMFDVNAYCLAGQPFDISSVFVLRNRHNNKWAAIRFPDPGGPVPWGRLRDSGKEHFIYPTAEAAMAATRLGLHVTI